MDKAEDNSEELESNESEPEIPQETPEERERLKIARFSQYVLSPQAWFRSANELQEAMKLLEPQIECFWKSLGIDAGIVVGVLPDDLTRAVDAVRKGAVGGQGIVQGGEGINWHGPASSDRLARKGVSATSAIRGNCRRGFSPMGLLNPLRRLRVVCSLGDQPRGCALCGEHPLARRRAGIRSFEYPSMVMDAPKSAACGPSSTGRSDKLAGGFELLWRFSEICLQSIPPLPPLWLP